MGGSGVRRGNTTTSWTRGIRGDGATRGGGALAGGKRQGEEKRRNYQLDKRPERGGMGGNSAA